MSYFSPMPRSQLELRSLPMIALAYFVGPVVGLHLYAAITYLPAVLSKNFSPEGASVGYVVVLTFGGVICALVEFFVVTPLLIGFHYSRWRWLNGFSGAAIGFLSGFAPWVFLSMLSGFSSHPSGFGHADGVTARVILEATQLGMVGMISAIMLRLIAVRSVQGLHDPG